MGLKLRKSAGVRVTRAVHRLIDAGNQARERQDWAEAAHCYAAAVAADPWLVHIRVQHGHMLSEERRIDAAIDAYRGALALDAGQIEVQTKLASLLYDAGRYVEARTAYAAAHALAPARADLADAIARLTVPNRTADEIVLLQSCDPVNYIEMLALSARTTRPYAQRHGLRYQAFIGVTRGDRPWHATYNRIDLLHGLVARDFRGWVLYMDCDSWIVDQAFDLRGFLADKADHAMIAAPAGAAIDVYWNINIGAALFNLAHPFMRRTIDLWQQYLANTDFTGAARDWMFDALSDQTMLQQILAREPAAADFILHIDKGLFNSPWATFVRQALRAEYAGLPERIATMRASIGAAAG